MLVSAIIPTRNRLPLLKEAVDSVFRQTYKNWELIIVDCESDDGTQEWVRSIADPRVRLLTCTAIGNPAAPRNIGVEDSKGEYLTFLDSDDAFVEDCFEKGVSLLQNSESEFAYGAARLWYDRSNPLFKFIKGRLKPEYAMIDAPSGWVWESLIMRNHVFVPSSIFTRSLFEHAGRFDETPELAYCEDYQFALRCACLTPFIHDENPWFLYRQHGGHSVREYDCIEIFIVAFERFLKWLTSSPEDFFPKDFDRERAKDHVKVTIGYNHWLLAEKLALQGDFEKACSHFVSGLRSMGSSPDTSREIHEYQEGLRYEIINSLDMDDRYILSRIYRILEWADWTPEQLDRLWERAADFKPETAEERYALAGIARRCGHHEDARRTYEECARNSNGKIRAMSRLQTIRQTPACRNSLDLLRRIVTPFKAKA